MTVPGSIVVIVAGLLVAALLSYTIGMIVAAIGLIGLVVSLVSGGSRRRTTV